MGHVLGSCFWYLILLDNDGGVCTGIATWHALGMASNLVSIGMCPGGLCLGVGNEMFIFE